MKKLLYILFLLITGGAIKAQSPPLGAPNTTVEVKGTLRVDSLFIIPNRNDTFAHPGRPGGLVFAYGKTWLYNGNSWTLLTGAVWGSIPGNILNQTDLMSLLNGKQTKLSSGYGFVIDTVLWKGNFDSAHVRKVDTIGRLNDSTVFFSVNGHTYNFKILGSASGTVVNAIALNTPSTLFNTPVTFTNTGGSWSGGLSLNNQPANTMFMGPTSGASAAPTFRALTIADLPIGIPNGNLNNSSITFSLGTSGPAPNWNTSLVALGGTALLNLPIASNVTTGILSSVDWIRFNSVAAATVTSVNGQQGAVITLNADSIFGQLVDTTIRRNGYALLYDSVLRKYYFGPAGGGGGGPGSVTTVSSGNIPNLASVSVATATNTPAFSFTLNSQLQNLFFASPNGSTGTPTWRALLNADLPTSGITAGTYNNITFNNRGIATAGSNSAYITLASIAGLAPILYNSTTGNISADTAKGPNSLATYYQLTQFRDTVNLKQVGAGINPLYTSASHDTLKMKGLNGSTLISITRNADSSLTWASLLNAQNSLTLSGVNINLVGDQTSPGNNFLYSTNGSGIKQWNAFSGFPVATTSVAGLMSAADKTTFNTLGTAAFLNVPVSGNATSGQVVIGTDTRLAPSLSNIPAPGNVALGISSGTGTTIPATTTVNAGVMIPGYKQQLDSLRQFSDSIRIYRKPASDSVFLCLTPIASGIEACAFQFRDSVGSGGGGGFIQLHGDGTAGPGTGDQAFTLATVNSNTGSFGDATHVPQFITDSKGRILGVTNVAIASASSFLDKVITPTTVTITSSNGSAAVIPAATATSAGILTASLFSRLADTALAIANARAVGTDSAGYAKMHVLPGQRDSLFLRGHQYIQGNGLLITDNSTTNTIAKTFTIDTSLNAIHPATQGFVTRGFVPVTRTITVNGVPLTLANDISINSFPDPTTTQGDILQRGSSAVGRLAAVATGNALISGGVGALNSWGKIGLTTHVAGTLPATNGGTGLSGYTGGDILYAASPTTLAALNDAAAGNALLSGGVGSAPAYGKIGLATHVSGTLPVANGGSGATTLTGYLFGNGTSAFTASSTIPGSAINGNITGNAANVTGTVAIANGGTGQASATAALVALGGAAITSPTFLGIPSAPTAAPGTNTTQLATTAFVTAAIVGIGGANFWTLTGNDIYNNNTGNVGIGTSGAPSQFFHVVKNQNAPTLSLLQNTNTGSSSIVAFAADNGTYTAQLGLYSSTHGANGALLPNSAFVYSESTVGLVIAENANAPIVFANGTGVTEKGRFSLLGNFLLGTQTDQSSKFSLNGSFWQNKDSAAISSAGSMVVIGLDTATGKYKRFPLNYFAIAGGGVSSITGTANQVIASSSTGAVTLSLPQSISTTSTPSFSGITLGTSNTVGQVWTASNGAGAGQWATPTSQNISNTSLTMQAGTILTGNNKSLSLGNFGGGTSSLSSFNVYANGITFNGPTTIGSDLTLGTGHIIGGSGNPSSNTLGGNVSSVTFSSTSNDLDMTITVVTSGNVAGTLCTILPAVNWSSQPVPIISCADYPTVNATSKIAVAGTNSGTWRLSLTATITGAGTYIYNIHVAQ